MRSESCRDSGAAGAVAVYARATAWRLRVGGALALLFCAGWLLFASDAVNPYTVGPPAYIIDDHLTYGGVAGQGGLEPQRDGGPELRTRRWDQEVMDQARAMYVEMIDRYDDSGSVVWNGLQETAIDIDPSQSDYSSGAYVDQIGQTMQALTAAADNIEISQLMNFVPGPGGNAALSQIYDLAVANGVAVGGPDLFDADSAFPYYDLLDDGLTPVDMSVQLPSLQAIEDGDFTTEEMLDEGINRLTMRMMFMLMATMAKIPMLIRLNSIMYTPITRPR